MLTRGKSVNTEAGMQRAGKYADRSHPSIFGDVPKAELTPIPNMAFVGAFSVWIFEF